MHSMGHFILFKFLYHVYDAALKTKPKKGCSIEKIFKVIKKKHVSIKLNRTNKYLSWSEYVPKIIVTKKNKFSCSIKKKNNYLLTILQTIK